uniref:Uncharacterized protein n=1 Tax=Callorhinchus milii TaxID=7868 RepID=A0A4W3K9N9_CALMI
SHSPSASPPPSPPSSPPPSPPSRPSGEQSLYRPVLPHWFYCRHEDNKPLWVPFSTLDSSRLEEAKEGKSLTRGERGAGSGVGGIPWGGRGVG